MTDKGPKKFVLRESWEYKSIVFMLRALFACVIIAYAIVTLPSIWGYSQRWYIRQQPFSTFETLLDQSRRTGLYDWPMKWMMSRPLSEQQDLAQVIERRAGELPALFFSYPVTAARARGDTDNAAFWIAYQKYRLRFDLLRCGDIAIIPKIDDLFRAVIRVNGLADEFSRIAGDRLQLADMLQKVLAFDAQHPAVNDPRDTCTSVMPAIQKKYQPVDRDSWENIRFVLRNQTDQAIHAMRAGEKKTQK